MTQKRSEKRDIHGWIVLDKPSGMTSTQAVGAVRWALKAKKAGHAGTLDPLATGVLPIALGEATKTVAFAMDGLKRYRFTVKWGEETDTDDAEGRVVATSDTRPDRDAIEDALHQYVGEIQQVPPRYSAIKVEGERAYDLAREGEIVELDARTVEIHALVLTDMPDDRHAVFECECGKGTYVRALARDIGRDLGCLGHVVALRRTRVGAFDERGTVQLDEVTRLRDSPNAIDEAKQLLRLTETALQDLPEVRVDRNDADRLRRGQAILIRGRDAPIVEGMAYVTCFGELIAIGEVSQASFQPTRVFHLSGIE
jgi:tRNA pseudouridine55 synthase